MLNPDRAIFLGAAFFLAAACTSAPESAQPVLNDRGTTLFQFDPTLDGANLESRADIGTRAHKPSEWPVKEAIAIGATGFALGMGFKFLLGENEIGENEKRKSSTSTAPAQPATTSEPEDPRHIEWTPAASTPRNRKVAAITAQARNSGNPLYWAATAFFAANVGDVEDGVLPVSPKPTKTKPPQPQQGGK